MLLRPGLDVIPYRPVQVQLTLLQQAPDCSRRQGLKIGGKQKKVQFPKYKGCLSEFCTHKSKDTHF